MFRRGRERPSRRNTNLWEAMHPPLASVLHEVRQPLLSVICLLFTEGLEKQTVTMQLRHHGLLLTNDLHIRNLYTSLSQRGAVMLVSDCVA